MTNQEIIARMTVDDYFHRRIWWEWCLDIFAGVTDLDSRVLRIRGFILRQGLADVAMNPKARPGVIRDTWRSAFERGYKQSLDRIVAVETRVEGLTLCEGRRCDSTDELPEVFKSAAANFERPASISADLPNENQRDLFSSTDAYARGDDPDTSHAAAQSVVTSELQAAVLSVLRGSVEGLTSIEVAGIMQCEPWSVSPRMKPLVAKGLVEDSGLRRAGVSGRQSIVWKAINNHSPSPMNAKIAEFQQNARE